MRLAFLSIGRHIHTERWVTWFARRGYECHLLTVQPGPVPGVTVHDIRAGGGPKPLRYGFSLLRVRDLLHRLCPDLLNTHFLTGYGYWGHFSGYHPNLLTVWGDDVYLTPHESRLKEWLARRALRSCDALTGDSVDILRHAVSLGADPTTAYRVLWGVEFDRFRPRDERSWRHALGFADAEVVYFSPRSFTQSYYNVDVIIEAAREVRQWVPNARFLFAGYEGDPEPFWQRARLAGIDDVSVFRGRLSHTEFSRALAACDVFISVPSVDATAVSLLEALASGCAVVVSSLASSREWVRDGETGLVVPPRDRAALVEALVRLGRDVALRRKLGEAAAAAVRPNAGFDRNMAWAEQVVQHLVVGAPAPVEIALTHLEGRG